MRPEVRVASMHLARLKKEAQVTKDLAGLAAEAVSEVFASDVGKLSKTQTKTSAKGLQWVLDSEGVDPLDMMKNPNQKAKIDPTDPMSRMVAYVLKKKQNPLERMRILGEFSNSCAEKDIEGMAEALNLPKETVAIVLLSYMGGTRVASEVKEGARKKPPRGRKKRQKPKRQTPSTSRTPQTPPTSRTPQKPSTNRKPQKPSTSRAPEKPSGEGTSIAPPKSNRRKEDIKRLREEGASQTTINSHKVYLHKINLLKKDFEAVTDFSKKAVSLAVKFVGGDVLEWLVKLIPNGYTVARPLKWTYWVLLIRNSATAFDWASRAFNFLLSIVTKVPYLGTLLSNVGDWIIALFGSGSAPGVGLLVFAGLAWGSYKARKTLSKYFDGQKLSDFNRFRLFFVGIWEFFKAIFKGVFDISSALKKEILAYLREQAPMFKYLIKKNDVDLNGVRELEQAVGEEA
jgi:hypothetical protein